MIRDLMERAKQPGGLSEDERALLQEFQEFGGVGRGELPPELEAIFGKSDLAQRQFLEQAGRTPTEVNQALAYLKEIAEGRDTEALGGFSTRVLQQRGTEGLGDIQALAKQLMASGGMTPELARMLATGQGILGARGRTPELDALAAQGRGLFERGGMTPELAKLFSQASAGLESGGMTPGLSELSEQARAIVRAGGRGGALLPFELAISQARDEAATAARQGSEAAIRQSLARGGGPGALTSGLQGRGLAEFSDRAAQAEAAAIREASRTQQGLQLQQLLGGFQAGVGAEEAGGRRLATFAGLGGEAAGAASRNLATAGGLMTDAERLAAAREQFGGELGLKATEAARLRAALGAETGLGAEGLASKNVAQAMQTLLGISSGRTAASSALGSLSGADAARKQAAMKAFADSVGMDASTLATFLGQDIDKQKFNQELKFKNLLARLGIFESGADRQTQIANTIFSGTNPFFDITKTQIGAKTTAAGNLQQSIGQQRGWFEKYGLPLIGAGLGAVSGGFNPFKGGGGGGGLNV